MALDVVYATPSPFKLQSATSGRSGLTGAAVRWWRPKKLYMADMDLLRNGQQVGLPAVMVFGQEPADKLCHRLRLLQMAEVIG